MGRYAPGNTHLPKRTEWSLKSTCVQIQLTSLYAVSIPGQGLCKQLEPIRGGGGGAEVPQLFPLQLRKSNCLQIDICVHGRGGQWRDTYQEILVTCLTEPHTCSLLSITGRLKKEEKGDPCS